MQLTALISWLFLDTRYIYGINQVNLYHRGACGELACEGQWLSSFRDAWAIGLTSPRLAESPTFKFFWT